MGTFGRAGVNKAGSEDDLDMKLVSVTAGDCGLSSMVRSLNLIFLSLIIFRRWKIMRIMMIMT